MKKQIAWGTSKLLEMYIKNTGEIPFEYCIDDFTEKGSFASLPIKKSDQILKEEKGSFKIIIFAVSNRSLQEISLKLNQVGLQYGVDYIYYSDFFYNDFVKKVESRLGFVLDPKIYRFALSYTLNSRTLIQTTILGTWLFLELINHLNDVEGEIAEVGAFQGGNALCSLNFMSQLNSKRFYIFDSFEGFPELSEFDPSIFCKGDLNIETTLQEILDAFAVFPEAIVIKGFVPDTLSKLSTDEKFSLVFYDCDLYQPALDTYEFFWDRIVPGGFLVIHDYKTQEGGFVGVEKATHEFFDPRKIDVVSFFENTMAIVKKPI
jgi:hypothetical protein